MLVSDSQYLNGQVAPYKYDMVFKSDIEYDFMNKGNGPLATTVIVYQVKSNHKMPIGDIDFSMAAGTEYTAGIAQMIIPPI